MTPAQPARIHLLPAKAAPYVIVIRRKPSKCFHIIRWNTQTDALEHGSWFYGKLYPKRCDVSFDGNWMVYLAMGASGETWNGICQVPFLRTVAEGPNVGTWNGGGYWHDRKTLMLNQWQPASGRVPFLLRTYAPQFGGEDLGVLYPKWERDGWRRRGENYGTDHRVPDAPTLTVECHGDDGWEHRLSRGRPALLARYIGYLEHGYTFRFELEGNAGIVDEQVDSACWDSSGNLVFSRNGILYKYSPAAIRQGHPATVIDLEPLSEPAR